MRLDAPLAWLLCWLDLNLGLLLRGEQGLLLLVQGQDFAVVPCEGHSCLHNLLVALCIEANLDRRLWVLEDFLTLRCRGSCPIQVYDVLLLLTLGSVEAGLVGNHIHHGSSVLEQLLLLKILRVRRHSLLILGILGAVLTCAVEESGSCLALCSHFPSKRLLKLPIIQRVIVVNSAGSRDLDSCVELHCGAICCLRRLLSR